MHLKQEAGHEEGNGEDDPGDSFDFDDTDGRESVQSSEHVSMPNENNNSTNPLNTCDPVY